MKRAVVLGLLTLVSGSALADQDDLGLRAGVAASFGQFKGDNVPAPELDNKFIEDNAVGFKVYGQYKFNSWLGLEAAYHYSNNYEDRSSNPALPGKLELSFSGFSAQGLFYIPTGFDDFSAFVKAGYYDFDDQLVVDGTTNSNSTERGLVGGAGVIFRLSDQLGVRAEYEKFDAEVGDLSSANLSVEYYFGAHGTDK